MPLFELPACVASQGPWVSASRAAVAPSRAGRDGKLGGPCNEGCWCTLRVLIAKSDGDHARGSASPPSACRRKPFLLAL